MVSVLDGQNTSRVVRRAEHLRRKKNVLEPTIGQYSFHLDCGYISLHYVATPNCVTFYMNL